MENMHLPHMNAANTLDVQFKYQYINIKFDFIFIKY